MPWLSRRARLGSAAAAASARVPPFVSGASGNIVLASCACGDAEEVPYSYFMGWTMVKVGVEFFIAG